MVGRSWYHARRLRSRNNSVVIYHVTLKHILETGNVGETFFRFMLTSKFSPWDVNAISGLVRNVRNPYQQALPPAQSARTRDQYCYLLGT